MVENGDLCDEHFSTGRKYYDVMNTLALVGSIRMYYDQHASTARVQYDVSTELVHNDTLIRSFVCMHFLLL